ncbi:hypothetical protein [Metallibacterium scheffleri]|uniref:hypothetical protein n=1 Tax=Metallibacterium scheffleri TaxID=993689 RepID=UPI0015944BF4|nr:hypothetical protein [Metallibacterium scheffleri]
MHKNTFRVMVVAVAVFASGGLVAQAAAPAAVHRFYEITVAPAQDHAFQEGMKTWLQCLHQHGATHAMWAFDQVTGNLDHYVFESGDTTWAAMDSHDPAGKACGPTFVSAVEAHFSKGRSWVEQDMPKLSHPGAMKGMDYFYVTGIKVRPGQGQEFEEALGKFAAAASKTKWDANWDTTSVIGGGRGAEDYNMIWPNKSWAEMGEDPSPSAKAMMEHVYGKAVSRSRCNRISAWCRAWPRRVVDIRCRPAAACGIHAVAEVGC